MATQVKPVRPGTYIGVVGETIQSIPLSISQIVAVGITHNWGPIGTDQDGIKLCHSLYEFDSFFGSTDTSGRRAVAGALYGSGAAKGGGAGAVLVYRMAAAGSSAAAAVNLVNTTPATGLVLTAKYKGTRGNSIIAVVEDNPAKTSTNILKLYLNSVSGSPAESFIHTDASITTLQNTINASSQLVVASGAINAVPLALTASSPLTGGTSGTTLTGTEYSGLLDAMKFQEFSVLTFENLTDATIQQSVLAWIRDQVTANRPVTWVVGGGSSDTLSTALTRAAALADPRVINLGVGNYSDVIQSPTGKLTVTTAQLAPRIAGLLVARGASRSLTFARVDALSAIAATGPTASEIEDAIVSGITVFSRSTSADANLKIEKGVTTFVDDTNSAMPVAVFGDPRLVRVLDLFVRDLKRWGDENIIGSSPVNDRSRAAVSARAQGMLKALENAQLIVPGSARLNVPVPDPLDAAARDTIPFDFGWVFTLTANYVFGNGRIS